MTDPLPPYPGVPAGPPGRPATRPGERRGDRPASLARRVVPAVALLGAAGGLLVALDHPSGGAGATEAANGVAVDGATATPPGAAATTPSTTAPSSRSGSTSGSGGAASPTTTVPAAPTCTAASTVTGSTVQTRFGPMQLQASVAEDGSLCAVTALQTPDDGGKSVSINRRAVPTLTQRAVAAGSTNFSAVSGATISSNAYKQSLQSILDQR